MEDIKNTKPVKIVNQTKKPIKEKIQQWLSFLTQRPNVWLISFSVLLVAVVLSFVGLKKYETDTTAEITASSMELAKLESEREPELEENFAELNKRIEGFEFFLSNRVYVSSIFTLLEQLTLPQVRLVDLKANLPQATVQIGVEAIDYTALGQQIFVLQNDSRVKKVNSGLASLSQAGRVASTLEIELDPNFLTGKK